jgi:hypothetical protein
MFPPAWLATRLASACSAPRATAPARNTQIQLSAITEPAAAAVVGCAEAGAVAVVPTGRRTAPEPVALLPPAAAKTIPASARADTVAIAAIFFIGLSLPVVVRGHERKARHTTAMTGNCIQPVADATVTFHLKFKNITVL